MPSTSHSNPLSTAEEIQRMDAEGGAQNHEATSKLPANGAGVTAAAESMVGAEVKNFIADLEDLISAKTNGAIDVSKIKGDISARIADYKSSLASSQREIAAQARQKAEVVNSYVNNEPWKAVAIGFAAGLVVGAVISRR